MGRAKKAANLIKVPIKRMGTVIKHIIILSRPKNIFEPHKCFLDPDREVAAIEIVVIYFWFI